MRISFLIPSFNHSKYIGHTLDSIYSDAEGLDFEIIVIDDGSTDDSRSTIEDWRKRHPLVDIKITYRENRGVAATANELIRQASGDVIRCCASDDGVYAGSSLKIINRFKEGDDLVLVGDAWVIDENGTIIGDSAIELSGGVPSRMETPEGLKEEIVANWSIPGPCFAVRRQVYEAVGYYAEDLPIEDWDFFLRVAALCPMRFVGEYFSYYRVHPGNTSRTSNLAKRVRNLNAQLTAGRRRSHLFRGRLRLLLECECLQLKLKILVLRSAILFSNMSPRS
jgi:glycosyltransferase involved in cell wall biosynthesis